MTDKEFDLIKKILAINGELDKYVILCEDEQGRYIKYAFIDGEPHDNRCLSWYDKFQPNALKRNGRHIDDWKLHDVGCIYKLHALSCGYEDKEGDEHCSLGHPRKKCLSCQAMEWTYEEPVKCACWCLENVDFEKIKFQLTVEEIKELIDNEHIK